MQCKALYVILAGTVISFCLIAAHPNHKQTNTPPTVVITKPGPNERFQWNSIVRYRISVSDKEDGTSEYNEIAPHEVILKTVYMRDSAKARAYLAKDIKSGPASKGLTLIKTSTCFNCHMVKSKLIGPSFGAVAQRYLNRPDSIKLLSTKIIKGSKLVWGEAEMPPNPEMKAEDAREIVQWIMKNSTDPDIDYLPGIEGSFRTIAKPNKNAGKGVYVLTASYTDHGAGQTPRDFLDGKNGVILKGE